MNRSALPLVAGPVGAVRKCLVPMTEGVFGWVGSARCRQSRFVVRRGRPRVARSDP